MKKTVPLQEVERDICFNAGILFALHEIDITDSRELIIGKVPDLAGEFLKTYSEEQLQEDYIGKIDEFSNMKLREIYGTKAMSIL